MTDGPLAHREVTLLEVLERVLDKGVVIAGDLTISVAGVDLIYLGLRALLCSVETLEQARHAAATPRGMRDQGLGDSVTLTPHPSPLIPAY